LAPGAAAEPRILIVEDDRVVAGTLRLYLEQAGYRVAEAHDGALGLRLAAAGDVALVILDVLLPGLDGREVCRRLRAASAVPILMLTARTTEEDRIGGLELGADDYVGKPFSPREVVARVRALLRRAPPARQPPPAPLVVGELEIDGWGRRVRVGGREVALTPSERRLLEALARHPGRPFTREELIARAFGPDREMLERTVDTHVANLRRKLEAGEPPRYLLTVPGIGYRLARPDEHG
jgi:DNA-binding response OmpR family regulator